MKPIDASSRELSAHADAQLALVRELMAGHLRPDVEALRSRIAALERRYSDPEAFAVLLSEALPAAVNRAQHPRSRPNLEAALGNPWIGAARYAAEHKLPAATDALAPMLLPAISQAVKDRIAAFSLALQRASPTRRIGWKIRSLQTGLPLETVIEQDLDPFCVHRLLVVEIPSGNLIAAHRRLSPSEREAHVDDGEDDAYATAALLTAMRGFVRDAGIGESAAELSSIEVGKRTLHIAQQGSMLIAVEASGQLAHDLETSIHSELFPALRHAGEDPRARESVLATWRAGGAAGAQRARGVSFSIVLGLIGLLLTLALWGTHRWIEKRDIQNTVIRLEDTPGVAAVSPHRTNQGWQLNVAADPSVDIEPALAAALTPRERIVTRIDPIVSLDPTTVAGVLGKTLPPPQGVKLTVTRDSVVAQGQIPATYLDALRAHPRLRIGNLAVRVAADATITAQ